MGIRNIRKDDDPILRKKSREVTEIDNKILELLDDMNETMLESNGVGLAAVQVGVLKRVIIVDVGEGLIELINPVIIEQKGEQMDVEGCLSVPGKYGEVIRPASIVVEALNRKGEKFSVHGDKLLAVALCHEIDHTEGILFIDRVIRFIDPENMQGDEKV
jgi:peptide deformylase